MGDTRATGQPVLLRPQPEEGSVEAVGRGRLVLVAEDDPDLRELLAEVVRATGARVRTAATGRAALLLAREEPPDAALVDLGLPDLDGCAVAAALRADPETRWTALVAVTAAGALPRAVRERAGWAAWVAKPFHLARLHAALAAALGAPAGARSPDPRAGRAAA
jgi:CheY-like chemotaxis protein